MILTIPFRLITLHLSHIFLTLGLTFILCLLFTEQSSEKIPLTKAFAFAKKTMFNNFSTCKAFALLREKYNMRLKDMTTHI
jgi:hypothetical protein